MEESTLDETEQMVLLQNLLKQHADDEITEIRLMRDAIAPYREYVAAAGEENEFDVELPLFEVVLDGGTQSLLLGPNRLKKTTGLRFYHFCQDGLYETALTRALARPTRTPSSKPANYSPLLHSLEDPVADRTQRALPLWVLFYEHCDYAVVSKVAEFFCAAVRELKMIHASEGGVDAAFIEFWDEICVLIKTPKLKKEWKYE